MSALRLLPPATPAAGPSETPSRPRRGEFRIFERLPIEGRAFILPIGLERRGLFWWRHIGFFKTIAEAEEEIAKRRTQDGSETRRVLKEGL